MTSEPYCSLSLDRRGPIMNRKRITSTLALGLLIAAWCLLATAAAFADALPPPKSATPSPIVTPTVTTSAPGDVPAPASSSGDDARTGTLAIAGAVVILVAGGSVVALRHASKATAAAGSATADAPTTMSTTDGSSEDEGDS